MKWAVSFPEESILLVRPCLVALCGGNRPAGKLLSVLIYRYSLRQEHKSDAENMNEVKAANGEEANQDITFRIYRKQSQLVADMCDEVTEKTLHDVAVPTLQLFGYLDVDESPSVHCYDVHIDVVMAALEAYKRGAQQLEDFLIAHVHIQLEKFLINKKKFQLNKKKFLLPLEEVLIANRNFSNNKRGRKPRREAAGEAQSVVPQINLDCLEIDSKIGNENEGADAPRTHTELIDDLKEIHPVVKQELKTASGRLIRMSSAEYQAMQQSATASQYPIATTSAIGKDPESEDFDPDAHEREVINAFLGNDDFRLTAPRLTLAAKKGHTHGHEHHSSDLGGTHSSRTSGQLGMAQSDIQSPARDQNRIAVPQPPREPRQQPDTGVSQRVDTPEHTPGTAALPPPAVPPRGRSHGISSDQAHPSLSAPLPAQAVIPPTAGSDASVAPTAQASGRRRPPRGNKLVPIELSLLGEEVKRWIEEARGVKVRMTENNVKACNALAEQDGVSLEALAAYFEYVDQKWTVSLLEAAGLTGKESKEFLSFESNWPQLKRKLKGKKAEAPPADWVPDDNDRSTKAELWRQAQRERSGK